MTLPNWLSPDGFWPFGERAMHYFYIKDCVEWHRGARADCWLCQVRDNQDKPADAEGEK